MTDDTVTLGGNIELTGFRDVDGGSVIIMKKIIGNYARRFSELCPGFDVLKLQMKKIREREKSESYEIHGMLVDKGRHYNASISDMNLFFALDKVLKKLENELSHHSSHKSHEPEL
ncbi:hypothetical protein HYY72_00850 [Candidatus Woesearchaeota archaeon]|nr:hypothetical protein [Candidatus Woesearchaeota archaeon]